MRFQIHRVPLKPALPVTLALFVSGCGEPVKTSSSQAQVEASPPAESTENPPSPKEAGPPADPETTPSEPATSAAKPPAKVQFENPDRKEEPLEEIKPVLDIKETGKQIVITGHLRSEYQEKDMIRILSANFPEHKVESKLEVGQHILPVGGWGNRVCDLLVPFFTEAEDGHFHFEAGVTTLEGTVKSQQIKDGFQRMTGYVMEDMDSVGIENNLKVGK